MITYDTHAHIDQLDDIDAAMTRAHDAGVVAIVAQSMDLASCHQILELCERIQFPRIYPGLGMHPSEAKYEDVPAILTLIKEHREQLSHIGEIGLDFWYKWVRKDQEQKDLQRKVYRLFLECALEVDLPVVVHSRGCWRECFETLQDMQIKKAELHWYSGPVDVLKDILDAGYYVSTTPSLAYNPQSREAMTYAPIEQTLIETDSPVFFRYQDSKEGYKAEPKDVFRTLEAYCALKDLEQDKALEQLNKNAQDFFGIEKGNT